MIKPVAVKAETQANVSIWSNRCENGSSVQTSTLPLGPSMASELGRLNRISHPLFAAVLQSVPAANACIFSEPVRLTIRAIP